MKQLLFLIFLLNYIGFANAQTKRSVENTDPNKIYTAVEKEPQYPGGIQKLYISLQKSIHVPKICSKNIEGTKVVIDFVVEKDGSLTHIKAKGWCPATNKNIIKFLKCGPKWKPGSNAGKICRVRYTIPIQIELSQEE
jgi:protein TonB